MNEFVAILWEQMKDKLYMTPEQFAAGYEGCEFDAWRRPDGSIYLLFIVRGPEFHFVKFGDEPADRAILDKYPGALIDRYGYAQTKTPKDDTRQQRFNERLGFYRTGEDDLDIHYRIDHLRTRKPSCQL